VRRVTQIYAIPFPFKSRGLATWNLVSLSIFGGTSNRLQSVWREYVRLCRLLCRKWIPLSFFSTFAGSVSIDPSSRCPEMVLVDGDRCRRGPSNKTQVVAAGTQSQLKKPILICPCYVRLMGARVLDECLPGPPTPQPCHNQPFPRNPSNFNDPIPNSPAPSQRMKAKEWMRLSGARGIMCWMYKLDTTAPHRNYNHRSALLFLVRCYAGKEREWVDASTRKTFDTSLKVNKGNVE